MSNRFIVQLSGAHDEEREQQGLRGGDEALDAGAQNPVGDYSNVKQVNEFALALSRRAGGGAGAELEHLLDGQQKEQQQVATSELEEQQLLSPTNARVNFKEHHGGGGRVADNGRIQEQQQQQQQLQDSRMTQYNNGSGNNDNHCQLDIQKFSPEMQSDQQQQQQQYGMTTTMTIPVPTSLSTTTTTPTTTIAAKPAAAVGGFGGGGGGGGDETTSQAPSEFKGPQLWRLMVENWAIISQPLAIFMVFLMLWAIGYILLPQFAVPSSGIMRIAFLFVGAQTAGILVTFLHLPDMLGMLFFGVLYTNVGLADFTGYQPLEAFLREMALINIMLLAGLGLDWNAFKRLWLMILRLTLVPTIAEVTIIAVLARYLLAMPWLWGILLGLVVTAVSPNVVVTVMLKLKEERLGLNSGIHTLIYAMTTCNDVVAIFVFGVILGVIFSTGTLTDQILQGPIGIGIGVVFGYVYGLMLQFVPSRNSVYANGLRFVLTVLGGAIAVMGSKAIGYPSAGALGCVTVAFVAGIGWKRQQEQKKKQQQQQMNRQSPIRDANGDSTVAKRLDLLWKFLKPVSFALIGKEINFAVLDGRVVGYGLLLVLLGSLFRLGFAYISTYGGNLSRKERAYITISGFPKATVQAALGPIALDLARSLNADQENLALANNVLIISVLAIIFTAPIGAILMLRLAPCWLQRSDPTGSEGDNVMDSIKYAAQNLNCAGNKSRSAPEDDDDEVGRKEEDGGQAWRRDRHLV